MKVSRLLSRSASLTGHRRLALGGASRSCELIARGPARSNQERSARSFAPGLPMIFSSCSRGGRTKANGKEDPPGLLPKMLAAGYADVLLQTTAGTMTQPVARLLVDGKSALARGDTLRWASAEAARLRHQRLEESHALDASADEFRAGAPRSHSIPQNRVVVRQLFARNWLA